MSELPFLFPHWPSLRYFFRVVMWFLWVQIIMVIFRIAIHSIIGLVTLDIAQIFVLDLVIQKTNPFLINVIMSVTPLLKDLMTNPVRLHAAERGYKI